jgi:hypothetical protein
MGRRGALVLRKPYSSRLVVDGACIGRRSTLGIRRRGGSAGAGSHCFNEGVVVFGLNYPFIDLSHSEQDLVGFDG